MNLELSSFKESKNLLAFSAGVDSCALFLLLKQNNIDFDIAIVNYNLREQAKEEVLYAKKLAKEYKKKIYILDTKVEDSNFEKKARDIRYRFFEDLIQKYKYSNLFTAHQLNDKLEWFLMQLSKGSGIFELLGLEEFEQRDKYSISRPLLNISKNELENYLKRYNFKYFVDESNFDEKYKRNYFRHNFSNKFLEEFEDGVKNSFSYLQKDLNSLNSNIQTKKTIHNLEIFNNLNDDNLNIRIIDKSLKKRGVLISSKTRKEILSKKELVISHKISISITKDKIFIAPFIDVKMEKRFKENCRINKIPKNIRPYLFKENIDLKELVF